MPSIGAQTLLGPVFNYLSIGSEASLNSMVDNIRTRHLDISQPNFNSLKSQHYRANQDAYYY
jgi:hypothetical protein